MTRIEDRFPSSHRRPARLRLLTLVLMALAAAGASAEAAGLRGELSAVKAQGDGQLLFSLRNTSPEAVYVLAYETPLRGFSRDLFVVTRDGEPIPYMGILAQRLGPAAEDWIRIEAGGEVSAVIDLSSVYDLRQGGNYSVAYAAVQQVHRGSAQELPIVARGARDVHAEFAGEAVKSDTLELALPEGAAAAPEVEESLADDPTQATFGCSSPSTLTSAQSTARSRALRAYNASGVVSSWFTTWFGASSAYLSTIRGRFANAYNRLGQTVNYYCGANAPYCSSNTIAYTYKTTSNRIYICNLFWSQSSSFRAHAVGHESYHWNTVAGADDVTYGSSQCQSLARTRPGDARRNADNYAYAADTAQ